MSVTNGVYMSRQKDPRIRRSIGKLAHDAIELGELQLELVKQESCEALKRARMSFILATIGFTMLMASFPVALFALAEVFVDTLGWSRSTALGVSAVGSLSISIVVVSIAAQKFRQGFSSWKSSSEELRYNIAWLKAALQNDAAADRKQQHSATRAPHV